jgi:hypothetical protein
MRMRAKTWWPRAGEAFGLPMSDVNLRVDMIVGYRYSQFPTTKLVSTLDNCSILYAQA